ncbi:hypothetical protein [Plantactinospora soyae]|uniref:Prolyl-tRNA synthetase n=1 Tax=Plantactinospora soyae TaxID=1544732 RepID=A0A927MAC1_9ACTN|nr:hypothetical protein [Plantactinospora soyae]MBE1489521.1 prolyl-tRNA synthetase [Plantactinospora soyae]
MSAPYHRALVEAELIAATAYPGGITVWRSRGLRLVAALVEQFRAEVASVTPAVPVHHGFLQSLADYRRVFPTYTNVFTAGEHVLRADNMHTNVAHIRASGQGPVVSANGLIRSLRGGPAPLFRERHIWPAIQLNDVVPRSVAVSRLAHYAGALERTLARAGLPAITIETGPIGGYGRLTYLTVASLPDGRPTIVATAYVMADRYREALAVPGDVIDVGFTGKVIALLAMHHRDRIGLQLPSRLAPVQVGVVSSGPLAARWLDSLGRAGLRVEVVSLPVASDTAGRRARAERRLLRLGVPVVVGLRENRPDVRVTTRRPLTRECVDDLPTAERLAQLLEAHDRRQAELAGERFRRGLRATGLIRGICPACAGEQGARVYGWIRPSRPVACTTCQRPGTEALVTDSGRFY